MKLFSKGRVKITIPFFFLYKIKLNSENISLTAHLENFIPRFLIILEILEIDGNKFEIKRRIGFQACVQIYERWNLLLSIGLRPNSFNISRSELSQFSSGEDISIAEIRSTFNQVHPLKDRDPF